VVVAMICVPFLLLASPDLFFGLSEALPVVPFVARVARVRFCRAARQPASRGAFFGKGSYPVLTVTLARQKMTK
jgi:hypothetical protein